jgi:hypothetical protein
LRLRQPSNSTRWRLTFADLFAQAKKRVSQMSVRVIESDNPMDRTIFEVYASMELKMPYIDFDTH